jgi:hypothetical protein
MEENRRPSFWKRKTKGRGRIEEKKAEQIATADVAAPSGSLEYMVLWGRRAAELLRSPWRTAFVAFRESTGRLRPGAGAWPKPAALRRGAHAGPLGQRGNGHRRLAQSFVKGDHPTGSRRAEFSALPLRTRPNEPLQATGAPSYL